MPSFFGFFEVRGFDHFERRNGGAELGHWEEVLLCFTTCIHDVFISFSIGLITLRHL